MRNKTVFDEVEELSKQAQREAAILHISPYTRMKQLIGFQHDIKKMNCKECVYRTELPKSKKRLKTCAVIGESTDPEAQVLDATACYFFEERR